MIMQNKLYTIQFSHCPTTNCVGSAQTATTEPRGLPELTTFAAFAESMNFAELAKLTEKD